MINRFKDDYLFLSNFYISPFIYKNKRFLSSEHAYNYYKTFDRKERKNIILSPSPRMAKQLGRRCSLRNDWEEVKDKVMYSVVKAKFSNPELKELLLSTGEEKLEEGNYWHDNYWGCCKCNECINIKGKNKLGKILMRIRSNYATTG